MKTFHTIIVGAGPGGLACAATLAKKGKDVLLIEKNQEIGKKVCAGGIPQIAFSETMPQDLIEKSFSTQKIRSNWQNVTINSNKPIINTVNRENLGKWMLKEAQLAGATIRPGTIVREITKNSISTDKEQFGYKHLVGAEKLVMRNLFVQPASNDRFVFDAEPIRLAFPLGDRFAVKQRHRLLVKVIADCRNNQQ